ncbi:MAG: hypothetical protein CMC15_14890 [Flavobacteriaceae bacterium]|nr:hypothetical protein [Flavobacteriaceae bacterium]
MAYYCSVADVGSRLGLDSAQRTRANTRLTNAIRRASIDIDQEFLQYGRSTPSRETGETTLNGAVVAGATSIVLTSGTDFATSGNGNIDGDSFAWTGKSTHTLSGVTGISFDHADGVTVQEGEFAHVLREICGDLAAAYYLEDESVFQSGVEYEKGGMRSNVLRQRGLDNLRRLAHLGSVD